MNLSPEEKQIGKQNFDEAVGTTRRDFLKNTVLVGGAAAAASLGSVYFGYGPKLDDRLRVGILGTGDEGGVLMGALNPDYIDVVAIADIRPYSLHRAFYGDWYSKGAHSARPGLLQVYKKAEGWADRQAAEQHIKVYKNGYAELLDDPNVEAVIIALPLHLHHEAAVAAMRKGKHVLTEKLMAHNVAWCKEMGRVAKQTDLVLAVGHQRHYSILYDNAVQQIKQGLIGDIHHIRAQWHRANVPGNDSWSPPLPCKVMSPDEFAAAQREARAAGHEQEFKDEYQMLRELRRYEEDLAKFKKDSKAVAQAEEMQSMINQKLAQLQDLEIKDVAGSKYGYETKQVGGRERTALEELIRWRLWQRTGGGLMAELGSHQLDASSIFISAQHPGDKHVHPLSVTGVGGRYLFPEDRDCDDHVYCTFEFPAPGYWADEEKEQKGDENKKIGVTYSSINGNGFGGYGEIVCGKDGTLILEQEQDAMLFKGSATTTRIEVKDTNGKPAMDTYETGGGAAVAQAAMAGNVSRGYREEIEHWAWCIRNRAPEHQPHCTAEVALGDAVIALTSNIAIAKCQRIEFKKEWFDINRSETPDGSVPRAASEVT